MIERLYIEAKDAPRSEFDNSDPIMDVFHQLPYFCCPNFILDREIQEDISRYQYCEDTGTQPYRGTYGETPAKWISIHFILKNSIGLFENEHRKRYMKHQEMKNKTKGKY